MLGPKKDWDGICKLRLTSRDVSLRRSRKIRGYDQEKKNRLEDVFGMNNGRLTKKAFNLYYQKKNTNNLMIIKGIQK